MRPDRAARKEDMTTTLTAATGATIDQVDTSQEELRLAARLSAGTNAPRERRVRRTQPQVGIRRYPLGREVVAAILRLSRSRRPDWFLIDVAVATLERYDVIDTSVSERAERGELVLVTLNAIDVAHLRNFLMDPAGAGHRSAAQPALVKLHRALAA
jgi:hypothetical protein